MNKNKILKIIIFIMLGILIIIGSYFKLKFNHYDNNFDFIRDFNNKLFGLSIIGVFVSAVLWRMSFFKYLFISMIIVFLGYIFIYNLAKLDKTIYLENFSNTPKNIILNGRKYIVEENFYKRLEFPKVNIKIENKELKNSGCYIINLSYPKKILQIRSYSRSICKWNRI